MAGLIDISKIEVRNRQRTSMDAVKLRELRESILSRGLLHAPVAFFDSETGTYVLVAGERRFRAITQIYEAGQRFFYNGTEVPEKSVPITLLGEIDPAKLLEAEFDENARREDLTWQDQTRALAAIHALRQKESPDQTYLKTAQELKEKSSALNDLHVKTVQRQVREAAIVAQHLDNPVIAKARNITEAQQLILKQQEEKILAELRTRRLAAVAVREQARSLVEIRHGDALEILPKLEEGIADLILTDPPYGIEASGAGFRDRTVHHHNYEDTPDVAKAICEAILMDGFRVAKSRANLFMFIDIELFFHLREVAGRCGWVPFRTPIIWRKSASEGLAPWGRQGFRRTYEVIFFATKGQRGLISSPVDILDVPRVSKQERTFAAEKPVKLLRQLIECATLPGDFVLDPCCGSGSTLVAALESKRLGLGIEKDENTYTTAVANIAKAEERQNDAGSGPRDPEGAGDQDGDQDGERVASLSEI